MYVAFVIGAFSRRIADRRAHTTMRTDFVLDALEQALCDRETDGQLIHRSDRRSQYVSTRYTERPAMAGVAPSVGSVGDASDNALAESVIGLLKAEVIHRNGPWRGFDDVEYGTLEWVAWLNTGYYVHRTRQADLGRRPARARPPEFEQRPKARQPGVAKTVRAQ